MTARHSPAPIPAATDLSQASDLDLFQQLRSALMDMGRHDATIRSCLDVEGAGVACGRFDKAADRAMAVYSELVTRGVIGFLEDALVARDAA
jgi:hypothetical protein